MIGRNIRYNSTLSYGKRIVIIRKYTKKTDIFLASNLTEAGKVESYFRYYLSTN